LTKQDNKNDLPDFAFINNFSMNNDDNLYEKWYIENCQGNMPILENEVNNKDDFFLNNNFIINNYNDKM